MTKILLVEDDMQIAKSLTMGLGFGGFEVQSVGTVREGWSAIEGGAFDVLLLDVGLPDGSGIELCERVRAAGGNVPVLFLSARTDEETVVKGINVGADDYLRKPFGIEELKARIKKVMKRASPAGGLQLEAGPLKIDLEKRLATLGGKGLSLGKREFDILTILVKKNGDVVTRDHIVTTLDEQAEVYDRTIDSHISHLRRKMREAAGNDVQIVSVYGIGYRLEWER